MASAFAQYYDLLLFGVDYKKTADFIETAIKEHAPSAKNIADVSCGTGTLALELYTRGYNVTASDISADMLCVAFDKAQRQNARIMFLNQNMRDLCLDVQTDVVVSTLDSTNCLVNNGEIATYFSSVFKNLVPGGLFIFDVNTQYQFEHIYADNSFVLEDEGVFLAWQNSYNPKSRKCYFDLCFFCKLQSGNYERIDESICERMYSDRFLGLSLKKCGFELLGIYSDLDFSAPGREDRRHYFIARKK